MEKKNGRKIEQAIRRRICLKKADMPMKEWPKDCHINCWNEKAMGLQKGTPIPRQTYPSRYEQSYRETYPET
jgi:hypothetical protein